MTDKEQEISETMQELIKLIAEVQALLDRCAERHEAEINGR